MYFQTKPREWPGYSQGHVQDLRKVGAEPNTREVWARQK